MDKKTAILLLVVFIDLIGFGIVIPILPLLIDQMGGGAFLVGLTISVFSLFQFLFSPVLGRLSDKYGRKPILIFTSLINSLSYFLIFLFPAFFIIFLARIIAGIGSANISVAQAYIADTSKSHERTKKMALLGASFGLGFIVGPLLGGVASSSFGPSAPFLVPGVLSLLNTILIYLILSESNKVLQEHIKIEFFNIKVTKEVLRPKNISFLIFLFFFANLALALIMGVFPLYALERFGWDEARNGYFFGLIGFASFFTQIFIIRQLLKRVDETQIIKLALLIFGIAVIGMGLSPSSLFVMLIGPFSAVGFSLVNVGVQSLISLESTPEEQGIVLGVSQSFASLARVFGPLAGGLIATFNISAPYVISGLIALVILYLGRSSLRYISANRSKK